MERNFTSRRTLSATTISAYKNDLSCMTFVYVQIVKCNPDPCLLLSQFLREECIIFVQNCYRKINQLH